MKQDMSASPTATGLAGAEAPEPHSRLGVRLAVVRSRDGYLTVCGPNDFRPQDYPSMMDAALGYHLEAGHIPAASYWLTVELPPLPTIDELAAQVRRAEFPQSFLDTIIEEGDPLPEVGPAEPPADFGRL